jgi:hypothetical protein
MYKALLRPLAADLCVCVCVCARARMCVRACVRARMCSGEESGVI